MRSTPGKALYLVVASILGILLFTLLQTSAFTVYTVLLGYSNLGLASQISEASLQTVDAVTTIAAILFGAWYGIWLGLNWHTELYGDGKAPGMFHAFLPHSMRKSGRHDAGIAKASSGMPSAMKTPVSSKTASRKSTSKAFSAWSFDDLQSEVTDKKPMRKPRVVKSRKSVTKKKEVFEQVT